MGLLPKLLLIFTQVAVVAGAASFMVTEAPLERMDNQTYWKQRFAPDHTLPIRAVGRGLVREGQPFRIRGISFNGMETDCHAPMGLWSKPLSFFFDVLRDHKFNALRIPLPYEVLANPTLPVGNCVGAEPRLHPGMPAIDVVTTILDLAHENGIVVLFDLHTIGGVITPLPWTDSVNEDMVVTAWVRFVEAVHEHPAFMGIEIKNEPHDAISLDRFFEHCAKVIGNIHREVPKYSGLFFISGVQNSGPWGGSFDPGTMQNPQTIPSFQGITHPNMLCVSDAYADQIVLNPHVYGTSVRGQGAASEGPADWERAYGFVTGLSNHWNQATVVPTEWGGYLDASDTDYYTRWTEWHVHTKGFTAGGFWWTLGPFSTDTGGLLDDQYNLIQKKMDMITRLTPDPTPIAPVPPRRKRGLLRKTLEVRSP